MSEMTFTTYPDPDFRGTYGLVSDCVTTLSLCVWTAVHLDVPTVVFKGGLWTFYRKGKWVLLGMLAPELLLFIACLQLWSAHGVQREADILNSEQLQSKSWNQKVLGLFHRVWDRTVFARRKVPTNSKNSGDEEKAEYSPLADRHSIHRKHPWTLVHSFYACMGGFAFDTSQHDSFLPENQTRITLTPTGIRFLMKYAPEIIPDISVEELSDKSKANGLAKLLVCFQAAWFCVQFIARIAQSLSFSLLELNTFAHAACALISYGLWWKKPLDISEPTLIPCEAAHLNARQTCAFMYVISRAVSEDDEDFMELFRFTGGTGTPARGETPSESLVALSMSSADSGAHKRNRMRLARQWMQQHSYKIFEWRPEGSSLPVTRDFGGDYNHSMVVIQTKVDMKDLMGLRWQDIALLFQDPYILLRSICFCFIAAAYGLVHTSAWNLPFPTHLEQTLWRCSAILVAVLAFSVPLAQVFFQTKFWELRKEKNRWKLLIWVMIIPCICSVYSIARLFLVVESLRQVFYLPRDVFLNPSLTKYIPHFS
ncbi:hypothetical protein D9758_013759 [Tetrapyrgos nigripes]|uniref:Uncharacterized protein n=1 Tax=Tetrapyrgos nigripes TaxID=182062 RepID=A0A8H5D5N7_9AGAR|nr:hypothetical protein D9758_013759 [Tetrapyrgos nigripes]